MCPNKNRKKRAVIMYFVLYCREDQVKTVMNKFGFYTHSKTYNNSLGNRVEKAKIVFSLLIILAFFVSFLTLLIMKISD